MSVSLLAELILDILFAKQIIENVKDPIRTDNLLTLSVFVSYVLIGNRKAQKIMGAIGRVLILFGSILIGLGLLLALVHKVPLLGKLPGDIYIQRKNFTFYFPWATSLLVSIIVSLLFYLFNRK